MSLNVILERIFDIHKQVAVVEYARKRSQFKYDDELINFCCE